MPRRYYTLTYNATSRLETSSHPTRQHAMNAAYGRLDMEQRDALHMGEQEAADAAARERMAMASSWDAAVKGRDAVVYRAGRVSIVRHIIDPTP